MKKTIRMGTLAAILAAGSAQAAVLPLENATITASYNGNAAGMLGLDQGFAAVAGSNVTALDPLDGGEVEYLTADYLFGFDFSKSGQLTVYNNGTVPSGAYALRFDFGATLPAAITSFQLLDTSQIAGNPLLSVLDAHTIGLDLSGVSWNAEFAAFTSQIGLQQDTPVSEPAGVALLLSGLIGMALTRRRR